MAYVYRHIRLDTNQPFYIGVGSDTKFLRAYNFKARNIFWKRVVEKTEFEVEILFTDLSWEEACAKEVEFIKLYGRYDLNRGTLVNLTDGGDGSVGVIKSEATKKRVSVALMGKKRSQEAVESLRRGSVGKNKGRIFSEDHKRKIGLGNIGKHYRKHTDEVRAIIKAKRALQTNTRGKNKPKKLS